MSTTLTRDDVARIAELARLELTPDELDLFTRQLGDILGYVEQIRELDTSGVAPTSHVLNRPVERDDAPSARCPGATPLANAPDAAAGSRPLQGATSPLMAAPTVRPARDDRRATWPPAACARTERVRRLRSHASAPRSRASAPSTPSSTSAPSNGPAPIDATRTRRRDAQPLLGVPSRSRTTCARAGVPTTASSRILRGFVPPYSATVVARLEAAGAIVVGKTNLDEFAMGSSTENSAHGPTRNPWDLSRTPGGSSGGSAAAVAARHGAARAWFRYWRLDPPAGGVLRPRRPEADLRARVALRPARVRLVARSDWPASPAPPKTPRWCCR